MPGMAITPMSTACIQAVVTITVRRGNRSATQPSNGPEISGGNRVSDHVRAVQAADCVRSNTSSDNATAASWSPAVEAVEPIHMARNSRKPTRDRKSTRLNSSHSQISYAVFCLKKKKKKKEKKYKKKQNRNTTII